MTCFIHFHFVYQEKVNLFALRLPCVIYSAPTIFTPNRVRLPSKKYVTLSLDIYTENNIYRRPKIIKAIHQQICPTPKIESQRGAPSPSPSESKIKMARRLCSRLKGRQRWPRFSSKFTSLLGAPRGMTRGKYIINALDSLFLFV
jgi:hypothetical protein